MIINKVHPISLKLLRSGHPWITKDEYSDHFPNSDLLQLPLNNQDSLYFIHDPNHPRVKARKLLGKVKSLETYIEEQLNKSLDKREKQKLKRDNVYLCFSESDFLPGLYIQKLGQHVLIQYHAFIWEKFIPLIVNILKNRNFGEFYLEQMRIPGEQKKAPVSITQGVPQEAIIEEFEVKLKLIFNQNHDIGIYTDMSSIREDVSSFFKSGQNFLNLFSYTGAFSLLALKKGMDVTSVDLSKKYMNWLEENIRLNHFKSSTHQSIIKACDKMLTANKRKYELILCDPPSFSSNGKKRLSSFDFYKRNWQLLWDSLAPGGVLIAFLNTHSIPRKKFKQLILDKTKKSGKIIKELHLAKDCSSLSGFPESDYLKGFVIRK